MGTAETELRCAHKLHAIMKDEKIVEIACHSSLCGFAKGIIVLHRFSMETGELRETLRFNKHQDPNLNQEVQ